MSGYVQVCRCGHDKTTRFEAQHTCLGSRCDCETYTDRDDPLPKKAPVRPKNHPSFCKCYACKLAPALVYPRINTPAPDTAPTAHGRFCTCFTCFPFGP